MRRELLALLPSEYLLSDDPNENGSSVSETDDSPPMDDCRDDEYPVDTVVADCRRVYREEAGR